MPSTRTRGDGYAGLVVAFLAAVFLLAASSQTPSGPEFQVNTYTTSKQGSPELSVTQDGDFVVVWSSLGQDASSYGVFGQRYDATGARRGGEFQVNTYTTSLQAGAAVSSAPDGSFVVVWNSSGQDGDARGIFGQRYDATGTRLGSEFQVNTYTTAYQYNCAVDVARNGAFVVLWQSNRLDGSGGHLAAQRYDAGGIPLGSEFQINEVTTFRARLPRVDTDDGGNFVAVWTSYGADGSGTAALGRRFDAAGQSLGGDFQLNTYTTGYQRFPSVAVNPGGSFVVAWQGEQPGRPEGIFARRYDASGNPVGGPFEVDSAATGHQAVFPFVASDRNGNFIVTWQDFQGDGSGSAVFARRFDSTGAPLTAQFQVNSYTTGGQSAPRVSTDPDGDFVVVWQSPQDGSGYGVFGQRYGDLIFQDGFESQGLGRWSAAASDGGDLAASAASALAGTTAGLQASVNDTHPLFVQDDTPSAENRYRVRFYFDPNGFDPGEGSSHFRTRIFIAFDGSNRRLVAIVLRRRGGSYSVDARVRLGGGIRADTGFFPLTGGPHFLEFDWVRASGPAAADGSFELRLDDAILSTLTSLDNDAAPVELARLGALSVKPGASGTLYFDQFESRRQAHIGPD